MENKKMKREQKQKLFVPPSYIYPTCTLSLPLPTFTFQVVLFEYIYQIMSEAKDLHAENVSLAEQIASLRSAFELDKARDVADRATAEAGTFSLCGSSFPWHVVLSNFLLPLCLSHLSSLFLSAFLFLMLSFLPLCLSLSVFKSFDVNNDGTLQTAYLELLAFECGLDSSVFYRDETQDAFNSLGLADAGKFSLEE